MLSKPDIENLVSTGKTIKFTFPIIDDKIKDILHHCIKTILLKYNKLDFEEFYYSSMKELVINGIKANMKHYFFKLYSIMPDSEESITEGYRLLKEKLNENDLYKFEEIALKNNLSLYLSIVHSDEKIITFIENTSPLSDYEDGRIREKFTKALKYENIAEFYMDNPDDIEGSGLGITMIVLMLKANMIDPHAFTIKNKENKTTIARLEIPLKEDMSINRNS